MSQWPARLTVDPERVAALRRAAGATNAQPAAPLLYSRMAVFAAPESIPEAMGVPATSLRHAGHEWELGRALEVGRSYDFSQWVLTSDVTKPSRTGGTLRFAVFSRSWVDSEAGSVQTERMTAVHASNATTGVPTPVDPSWPADRPGPPARVLIDRDWDKAEVGEVVTEIDAGWLDRAAIASFGVLIGDLTAIHHDVTAARGAGLADVIAMGTFSAAITTAVAEDRVGLSRIRRCALRFHRPVFPGAPLRIVAVAEPSTATGAVFRVDLHAAGQLALAATLEVRPR